MTSCSENIIDNDSDTDKDDDSDNAKDRDSGNEDGNTRLTQKSVWGLQRWKWVRHFYLEESWAGKAYI